MSGGQKRYFNRELSLINREIREDTCLIDGLPILLPDPFGWTVGSYCNQRQMLMVSFCQCRCIVQCCCSRGTNQSHGLVGILSDSKCHISCTALIGYYKTFYLTMIMKSPD